MRRHGEDNKNRHRFVLKARPSSGDPKKFDDAPKPCAHHRRLKSTEPTINAKESQTSDLGNDLKNSIEKVEVGSGHNQNMNQPRIKKDSSVSSCLQRSSTNECRVQVVKFRCRQNSLTDFRSMMQKAEQFKTHWTTETATSAPIPKLEIFSLKKHPCPKYGCKNVNSESFKNGDIKRSLVITAS